MQTNDQKGLSTKKVLTANVKCKRKQQTLYMMITRSPAVSRIADHTATQQTSN